MNCTSFPHSFVISYKEPLRTHKLKSKLFLSFKTRLASEPIAQVVEKYSDTMYKTPNKIYSFSYSVRLIYTEGHHARVGYSPITLESSLFYTA